MIFSITAIGSSAAKSNIYYCPKAEKLPTIDGKISEDEWKNALTVELDSLNAKASNGWASNPSGTDDAKATVRILWSDDNKYGGPFFLITLTLIPIVIGSALYGAFAGAWLGFIFGVTVLLSGDAAAFLTINIPGTIATVLVKGTLAGLAAGLVYKLASKVNRYFGVICSALVAPVVNTGIFLLG